MADIFGGIFKDIPIVSGFTELVGHFIGGKDTPPVGDTSDSGSGFSKNAFRTAMATMQKSQAESHNQDVPLSMGQTNTSPNAQTAQTGVGKGLKSVDFDSIEYQWMNRLSNFAKLAKDITITQGGKVGS